MRIINADGSEAEMCGNGIRCLALFIREIESGHDVAPPCDLKYLISTMAGKIITEVSEQFVHMIVQSICFLT